MHIKYAGGEEFFEMASLESDRITISLKEEADKVEGRLHYSASEEQDWSPWASSDAPVSLNLLVCHRTHSLYFRRWRNKPSRR